MRKQIALCLVVVIALMGRNSVAQNSQDTLTDVQAKLAIIHHFVSRYVQWPGRYALGNLSQIYICSFGSDAVTEDLMLLEQASTPDLRVFVQMNPKLSMANECHVVYIAPSEKGRAKRIVYALKNYPVLTIADISSFNEMGGMVELHTNTRMQGNFEKNYVRYNLNIEAIKKQKMHLDPDAVELAQEVYP